MARSRAGAGPGPAAVAGASAGPRRGRGRDADDDLAALWAALDSLRNTVENDHDHRLRRIETDLRWVIVLLGGQIVALLGAAVSGLLSGG